MEMKALEMTDARAAPAPPSSRPSLLLSENPTLAGGPPLLFRHLSEKERELVLREGQRRVVYRGKRLFSQGASHDGIFLIESGRIRVFYTAPLGREITLAYWYPGNFVGGPELFGQGHHVWSGIAAATSIVVYLPGKALRRLIPQMPGLAFGLLEGLTFKGKCYSALAQMLGTRSVGERLVHLLLHLCDTYGIADGETIVIGSALSRSRAHGRIDPPMGHDQPEAPAGARRPACRKIEDRRLPDRAPEGDPRQGVTHRWAVGGQSLISAAIDATNPPLRKRTR
jgi:CRP-like cAMP-binding protein